MSTQCLQCPIRSKAAYQNQYKVAPGEPAKDIYATSPLQASGNAKKLSLWSDYIERSCYWPPYGINGFRCLGFIGIGNLPGDQKKGTPPPKRKTSRTSSPKEYKTNSHCRLQYTPRGCSPNTICDIKAHNKTKRVEPHLPRKTLAVFL